jgi:hypothetical protein
MLDNTMENTKYQIVGTVSKPIERSQEEVTSIPLTHRYITAHFPGFVQALQ